MNALQALPRDQREARVTTRLMVTKLEIVAQRPCYCPHPAAAAAILLLLLPDAPG